MNSQDAEQKQNSESSLGAQAILLVLSWCGSNVYGQTIYQGPQLC